MAVSLAACLVPACLPADLQGAADAAVVGAETLTTWIPLVDWLGLAVVIAAVAAGALAGLARAFGMLLWLLAALWLAHQLSGHVVSWMPNTAEPGDPSATLTAFGIITVLVLALPVVGRLLGGSSGKKKAGSEPQHKPFGALVGLLVGCLFLTLLLPYVRELSGVGGHWQQAFAPTLAEGVADNASYLYPDVHRAALR